MKLSELKKLCAKSLELTNMLHTLEIKQEDSTGEKSEEIKKKILVKARELKICKEKINEYTFLFATSVRNLKEILQVILQARLNSKVQIEQVKSAKICLVQQNTSSEIVEKNVYDLVVYIKAERYPILRFVTDDNLDACEYTSVNLFDEGFVISYNYKTKFEQVERDVFNSNDLAWWIAGQNLKNLHSLNNKGKQGRSFRLCEQLARDRRDALQSIKAFKEDELEIK